VKITPDRMAELTSAEWVDVCQHPSESGLPPADHSSSS
jgi:hypothetical protein